MEHRAQHRLHILSRVIVRNCPLAAVVAAIMERTPTDYSTVTR